ncbi:hypothetical protein KZ555_003988 [Escherichia coli]|nr:hypothetical protein [Escherichia coli]
MTRDQQRLADYLSHILEAIERIDRYTEDMDELGFLNNQFGIRTAVSLQTQPNPDTL